MILRTPDLGSTVNTTGNIAIRAKILEVECYCVLFRKRRRERQIPAHNSEPEMQKIILFNKFQPYENEQLACIYDYLFGINSKPFNHVAMHDVQWGEWNIPYANAYHDPDNSYKSVMSQGLRHVHKLAEMQTYDERYA